MTIVPTISATKNNDVNAVRLARYAQRVGYPECQFFGVNNQTTHVGYDCRDIWSQTQRDNVAYYLGEAQQELEDVIKYPLQPTWIVGTAEEDERGDRRFVDETDYRFPLLSKWGNVIAGGVKGTSSDDPGVAVNLTPDPAVVTATTTAGDVDEVVVFEPGTRIEIDPSSIIFITKTQVVIEIPRCRLVKAELKDNPISGLDYEDLSNFYDEVDVFRIYNDPSTQTVLVCSCNSCSSAGCSSTTQTACINVKNSRIGDLEVLPATYENDAWAKTLFCGCGCRRARLYYQAGVYNLTSQAEDAIIRLAHSKMPQAPCGCDVAKNLWQRDRNVPQILTRERVNCPFGMSDGAWIAWRFGQSMRILKSGITSSPSGIVSAWGS